jgi:NitT/TauT family transport system ATP-binding protein
LTRLAALEQAEVDYGRGPVLGPIDLAVEAGSITALVGPSGSGKSTALRLLAGLEPPSRGRVERAVAHGETAMVFQAPTLMPWADALTNAALPLELSGVPREAARARAASALDRVGLADAATKRPAQLSGGMAMRVSVARALATEPRLLLLDEPFSALDTPTRRRLLDDVHRLWAGARPGVVFVTHDVDEAVYLADRVMVLTPGPGRVAAMIPVEGSTPRPPGFRAAPAYREAVERAGAALFGAMSA